MRGTELTPWLIRHAYQQGIFPMTTDGDQVEWFLPERRALFPISGIRVSRSLRRAMRCFPWEVTFNKNFEQVIRGCLRPHDNWISEEFIRVYGQIHSEGWAHSCEVWLKGQLVGGVYGLSIGRCFCAESMFHRTTNASKIALLHLVERCRECGFTLFDAQIMNPHLASLGAFEVPNSEYQNLLSAALSGAPSNLFRA